MLIRKSITYLAVFVCLLLSSSAFGCPQGSLVSNKLCYTVSDNGVTITGFMYPGSGGGLVHMGIPDYINGMPVVSIGDRAFESQNLDNTTIPSSVTSIGVYAYEGCSNLMSAYFYGNAPSMGNGVFDNTGPGFTVYYTACATGFTNPWYGYPTAVFETPCTVTTTTSTTSRNGPCAAKQVLGGDNPQLENLRYFRDSKLANSTIGRKAIKIYYNNADSINDALGRNPALRALARKGLEVIAPMLGKMEE